MLAELKLDSVRVTCLSRPASRQSVVVVTSRWPVVVTPFMASTLIPYPP